jgi:hypothetical protein
MQSVSAEGPKLDNSAHKEDNHQRKNDRDC